MVQPGIEFPDRRARRRPDGEGWSNRRVTCPTVGRGSAPTANPKKEERMSIARHNAGPRMSQAVVHGDTVYLAGQVASDPSAGVKGQTEQVLKKIDTLLTSVGSSRSKLLSATV